MQRLRYSRYFKTIIILLDVLVIASVFFAFFIYRNNQINFEKFDWEQNILSIALLTLFWILLSGRTKIYHVPRNLTYTIYLERFVSHILIFLFGIVLLGKVSNNDFIKTERFWLAFSLFFILLIIKSIIFFTLKYLRTLGINHRNVMFIGETPSVEILRNTILSRKDYGFKLFNYPNEKIEIDQLNDFWKVNGIHTIFMPSDYSGLNKDVEKEIFREAELNKVKIALIPAIVQNEFFEYDIGYIETQPVLTPAKFPLDYFTNYILKRTFDLLFSLLVLLFIGIWLFPIIAVIIMLESKGSPFFLQKRYGYHDEVFNCIKFRSMVVNDESSTKTTQEGDERITKFGKFLRKTSLDELPQFINVLKGEMSVVGPRPHMLIVDDFYKAKINKYSVRSIVKPGVTGLAQVNGLRGDNGDMNIEMKKRILADYFYVKNWSLSLDFVIILKTLYLVIAGDKKAR